MSNIKQTLVLVMLLRLLKVRNKIPFSALSPTSVLQSKSPLKAVTTVYSGDSKVLKVDRLEVRSSGKTENLPATVLLCYVWRHFGRVCVALKKLAIQIIGLARKTD